MSLFGLLDINGSVAARDLPPSLDTVGARRGAVTGQARQSFGRRYQVLVRKLPTIT